MIENNSGTIRVVAWAELFPWLSIVRVFRLAIAVRALLLGAVGILITLTAWGILARILAPEVLTDATKAPAATQWLAPYATCSWRAIVEATPEPCLPFCGQVASIHEKNTAFHCSQQCPVLGPWALLTQPAWAGLGSSDFSLRGIACLILCGLSGAATWAFFGAAICRTAAVQLATGQQVGLGAALRFACKKWPSYFFSPLLPLGGVLLAAIPVIVLGWIMHANLGVLLGGILWPLVLVAGFLMAILLLGTLFGWPLMWSAISVEGTDSFDALSRSYSYVFQRPLRYLFYIVVAAVVGWLGWVFVRYFAEGVIWLGYWAAGWGCGKDQLNAIMGGSGELSGIGHIGARLIHFWTGCIRLLAIGYLFSYFWTASTAIYFLLRHDVDATELDEVYLDADATEPDSRLPVVNGDSTAAATD